MLVHYPVLDRGGARITTAITNLDVHDIARSAFTYGLSAYYIVHPIAAQRELVERVRKHWVEGAGGLRIPDRVPPLSLVRVVASIEQALADFDSEQLPELWTTSARAESNSLPLAEARRMLRAPARSRIIAFGTGWGLAPEVHARADAKLAPLTSPREDGFNHLSVRAAAAILFDRLLGEQ